MNVKRLFSHQRHKYDEGELVEVGKLKKGDFINLFTDHLKDRDPEEVHQIERFDGSKVYIKDLKDGQSGLLRVYNRVFLCQNPPNLTKKT